MKNLEVMENLKKYVKSLQNGLKLKLRFQNKENLNLGLNLKILMLVILFYIFVEVSCTAQIDISAPTTAVRYCSKVKLF